MVTSGWFPGFQTLSKPHSFRMIGTRFEIYCSQNQFSHVLELFSRCKTQLGLNFNNLNLKDVEIVSRCSLLFAQLNSITGSETGPQHDANSTMLDSWYKVFRVWKASVWALQTFKACSIWFWTSLSRGDSWVASGLIFFHLRRQLGEYCWNFNNRVVLNRSIVPDKTASR